MLSVENLAKSYAEGAGRTMVLEDISFELAASETLALTGEVRQREKHASASDRWARQRR